MILTDILKKIGLNEKEAQIYLANLEIGSNTAGIIAKKVNLPRTTAYSILSDLKKRGFVRSFSKNNAKYFNAIDPTDLLKFLDKKEEEIKKQKSELKEVLPILESIKVSTIKPPKMQYFEGLDGLKKIYDDTLKGDHKEKSAFSSIQETEGALKKFIDEYLKKRVQEGIEVKAIFQSTGKIEEFIKQDKIFLRESKVVQIKKHKFKSEINIYGDKVAFMSLADGNYHGVIVESAEIAETMKAVFEMNWER